MEPLTLAVLAGLGSAATYGAGDFSGGFTTRREPALRVVALSHLAGLVAFTLAALLAGEPAPRWADLAWGSAAGLSVAVGTLGLYRGLALGPMSTVAPVTAIIGAALPVALQVSLGAEALSGLRAAGFVLALAGIFLVSRSGGAQVRGSGGLWLGVVGGLGFGGTFALLAHTAPTALFWPLAVGRAWSAVILSGLALGSGAGLHVRAWRPIAATALFDALGNLLYVVAAHSGEVVVAVVLCSLYPATTVLLALILLRERPRATQWAGLALVLAATALIAAPGS